MMSRMKNYHQKKLLIATYLVIPIETVDKSNKSDIFK